MNKFILHSIVVNLETEEYDNRWKIGIDEKRLLNTLIESFASNKLSEENSIFHKRILTLLDIDGIICKDFNNYEEFSNKLESSNHPEKYNMIELFSGCQPFILNEIEWKRYNCRI